MKNVALTAACLSAAVLVAAAPALADSYPVTGRWGQSSSTEKGPIACDGLRIIAFNGNQRTDSNGGVPAYRNRTVQTSGAGQYRVVDEFSTGQIGNARVTYDLRITGADSAELNMQPGGAIKLRKCK